MINDKISITLNEKTYSARLDFMALANTQWYIDNEKGKFYTVPDMMKGINCGNLTLIGNLVIESILRCHPQLDRKIIYESMKVNDLKVINDAVVELLEAGLPKNDDKKKVEEETEDQVND